MISKDASIYEALEKIGQNKTGALIAVDEENGLVGFISDGDIRRFFLKEKVEEIGSIAVAQVVNKTCLSIHEKMVHKITDEAIKELRLVPVVDSSNRVVGVLGARADLKIELGHKVISSNSQTFCIAEIGNNHNGSLELAKDLIDASIAAGADAVKFQMRDLQTLYGDDLASDGRLDLGTEYTLDLLKKNSLTNEEMFEAFRYSEDRGVVAMCTPWDLTSLAVLESFDMPAYKVASADMTNFELIDAIVATGKPIFVSTGMSSGAEIQALISRYSTYEGGMVLLHCNSAYPAPFGDINLKYIKSLQSQSGLLVGYSGHERGFHVPVAAVALGCKVIEKHITLDKSMEGVDHKVSLLPDEFCTMVRHIRDLEAALGDGASSRTMSQGEMLNRENLGKSIYLKTELPIGATISRDDLVIKSPGGGLPPYEIETVIGLELKKTKKAGDLIYREDFFAEDIQQQKLHWSFKGQVGIPVRFHDVEALVNKASIDFVEFHLTYQDLGRDLAVGQLKELSAFSVHAPELFDNDHILDLCSIDEDYRKLSVQKMNDTLDKIRNMAATMNGGQSPVKVIVNIGGYSLDEFLSEDEVSLRLDMFERSMVELSLDGVELLPQTMPPFPWHLGGQRFHNLLVGSQNILDFCARFGLDICCDVSHSYLASHHTGEDFLLFMRRISQHSRYYHMADSMPPNGEGLQIGEGQIDFEALLALIEKASIGNYWFIPEIWQGHKNVGQGFWQALNRLEAVVS